MAGAPFADGADDRDEAAPLAGQPVLDVGRHKAVVLAVDQSRPGQGFQLPAQDSGRDLGAADRPPEEAALDFAVAERPTLEVPQDADLVLAADDLLEGHDRAAAIRDQFLVRHDYHPLRQRKWRARTPALRPPPRPAITV